MPDKKIVIIDTETSAAHPVDCPIEIAAQHEDGTAVQLFLKPEFPITPMGTSIHGITNTKAQTYPTSDEAWCEFEKRIQPWFSDPNVVISGWNVMFDLDIIKQAQIRHEFPVIDPPRVLDLLKVAQRTFPVSDIGGYSLDAMYCYLFPSDAEVAELKEARQSHSAAVDVELTFGVYREMLARLIEAKGKLSGGILLHSLEDVLAYFDRPVILTHWPIGKYKGMKIADTLTFDPNYIQWLGKQTWLNNPRHADLQATLNALGRSKRAYSGKPAPARSTSAEDAPLPF